MAKEARQGSVKSRLARDIGWVAATAFHRRSVHNLVRRLAADRRWRTVLALTPDTSLARAFRDLPVTMRIAQGRGDLGRRMQRIMDVLPPGPVVIVGSDIPAMRRGDIAAAFRLLARRPAVFGPTEDGGYWLVGLRRSPRVPAIFAGVRWSSPHALADTLANLPQEKASWAPRLADVDDAEAYARLAGAGARVVPPLGR